MSWALYAASFASGVWFGFVFGTLRMVRRHRDRIVDLERLAKFRERQVTEGFEKIRAELAAGRPD